MEENFEKKSKTKIGVIVFIIILLLAAVIVGAIYISSKKKPEKIFEDAVSDVFEMSEKEKKSLGGEDLKSARLAFELSLSIKSNDSEIKDMNEIIKAMKLKSTTEMDLEKEIFNENIVLTYDGEEVINVDGLIQDETIYFYLKDIYSKYIEVEEDDLDGIDVSDIFKTNTMDETEEMLDEIKEIIVDEIKSRDFEQEKVELNGKKVQKSTLILTPEDASEILIKVLKKVNKYYASSEIRDLIENLEDEKDEDTENYLEISIYTKGLTNKIVKVDCNIVNVDYDEVLAIEIDKEDDEKTVVDVKYSEESASIKKAETIIKLEITSEEDNAGNIVATINADEDTSISIKLKYKIEYNVSIKKRNTSNSINANDITEDDLEEMYENIEDNEILNSIVQLIGLNYGTSTQIPVLDDDYYDDYYDYDDDDYYYDWDEDYYDYSDYSDEYSDRWPGNQTCEVSDLVY